MKGIEPLKTPRNKKGINLRMGTAHVRYWGEVSVCPNRGHIEHIAFAPAGARCKCGAVTEPLMGLPRAGVFERKHT